MASAAGGTSHRLKPGRAVMRSLDSRDDDEDCRTSAIGAYCNYRMLLMADTSSFDVTSPVDFAEVDNALNQARKEIGQRYDFKGATIEITLNAAEKTLTLLADDEMKMKIGRA